jgi:hypothetical protein
LFARARLVGSAPGVRAVSPTKFEPAAGDYHGATQMTRELL